MNEAYATLGLAAGASAGEIDAAYRRLVRRFPPELNPRRFARIKQAYELLSSYERRMREAAASPDRAIELLFPPVKATLLPPPAPPARLQENDWQSFLRVLREQAVTEILQRGLSPRATGKKGQKRDQPGGAGTKEGH